MIESLTIKFHRKRPMFIENSADRAKSPSPSIAMNEKPLNFFLFILIFGFVKGLDFRVFNLTHFLAISHPEQVLKFAKIVYEKGEKKKEIEEKVKEWTDRQPNHVKVSPI